jgi:hypothetical protein
MAQRIAERAMILRSTDGATVELVPLGYQFGYSSASGVHDNNWLNIRVEVSSDRVSWGGVDPCLLTWELRSLCSWLKAHVADPFGAEPLLEFMEPDLSFEVVGREADALLLRDPHPLCSRPRLRPVEGRGAVDRPACEVRELKQASEQLTRDAAAYPER